MRCAEQQERKVTARERQVAEVEPLNMHWRSGVAQAWWCEQRYWSQPYRPGTFAVLSRPASAAAAAQRDREEDGRGIVHPSPGADNPCRRGLVPGGPLPLAFPGRPRCPPSLLGLGAANSPPAAVPNTL